VLSGVVVAVVVKWVGVGIGGGVFVGNGGGVYV